MILIKHIEFCEVDRDSVSIWARINPYGAVEVLSDHGETTVSVSEIRELVRGRRYQRPSDGTDVVIGMSQQAQDVLGLQYEAIETMRDDVDRYHRLFMSERNKVEAAKRASLWDRIKWVFQGYS